MASSADLKQAIQTGDPALLARTIAADPNLVGSTFPDGQTPLHLAAQHNRPDLVEILVRAGAPLDAKYGNSSHTPLSWAITVWAFDAARKLVELGDEPDLFCAAGLGLSDRVKAFWTNGTVRSHPSRTGSSRFSESGDRLPCPPPDDRDQVSDALYMACRANQPGVARWLLDHGADPNWRGFCGATCLAWAEVTGDLELCALLRNRGASDDVLDQEFLAAPRVFGMTILAAWGFPEQLRARLAADRSLANLRGGRGTLLTEAARNNETESCRILLEFGADRSARDAEGRMPAEIAEANGNRDLAALVKAPA